MGRSRLFVDVTFDLLGSGQAVRFLVRGKSMHPEVRDGEMVTVVAVRPEDVEVGDIILYRLREGALAHRVIGKEERAGRPVLILRGDASASPDAPVEPSQVSGKVVSVEREGRRVRLDTRAARLRHRSRSILQRLRARLFGRGSLRAAGEGRGP